MQVCKSKSLLSFIIAFSLGYSSLVLSKELIMLDDFSPSAKVEWNFVADSVMGGLSTGYFRLEDDGTQIYAKMTGNVNTDNNGGFIQFRSTLNEKLDKNIAGVYLKVRGNGEKYFIHLRTRGTMLPWQYYQSSFSTSSDWTEVFLPLDSFKPSGSWLGKGVNPKSIRSLGVVAYGRRHVADVQVTEIGFYL